jgi:phytoene desaturase
MKVNILGAGIGGLSTAALLAKNGFQVNVIEQNSYPGGKAGQLKENGFVFDTGPSLLTLPDWIDNLFIECEKNPRDYFDYQRLETITRYFFNDDSFVDVSANIEQTAENFKIHSGLDTEDFLSYFRKWTKIYDISEQTFLKGELVYNFSFFKNAILWLSQTGISNVFSSMASYNSKKLSNRYVENIMNRFATYTGSSPYETPAFMNQLAVVEMIKGAFFPTGGIFSIPTALHQLCKDLGVNFYFNEKVESIDFKTKNTVIKTTDKIYNSKIAISNIDYYVTQDLIGRNNKISFKDLSTSAIVFYWGISQEIHELELHNILFSSNYKKEFNDIFLSFSIPEDPTIYINISSKFDKSHAPNGKENWFVMVNIPPLPELVSESQIKKVKTFIINQINKKFKISLEKLIEFEKVLTPTTLRENTGSYNGALYGKHQNSLKSIMNRRSNSDKLNKDFFYVGGSVHPGGGIPLALRSGMNTAKKIVNDYNKASKV